MLINLQLYTPGNNHILVCVFMYLTKPVDCLVNLFSATQRHHLSTQDDYFLSLGYFHAANSAVLAVLNKKDLTQSICIFS